MIAIETERAQIHFWSHVHIAVALLNLKVPNDDGEDYDDDDDDDDDGYKQSKATQKLWCGRRAFKTFHESGGFCIFFVLICSLFFLYLVITNTYY